MPTAAVEGGGSDGLCPDAARIEADLTGMGNDKEARIECARAYADCGRRHGEEGRLAEAGECLGRAVRLHGMWAVCSDACGRIAARLEGGGGIGRLVDAVVWYGKAVEYADGAINAGASGDARKEKKHKKRRSKWASECIRCWDALAGGAQRLPPETELDGPFGAADAAAGGDARRRSTLRVQMGDIELGRGGFGAAAEWYGEALEIDPGSERAALGAARALEGDGQWGRASAQYERAAAAVPRLREECAAGCARCALESESAGSHVDALQAAEAAAKMDASHAHECARMHHRRGDALAGPGRGRGMGGDAGGGADGDAASHYRRAVEWYRQAAGPAEAARGCAQCARALDRMGLHEEALSAIESAAELDASHALKCAGMHRARADALARKGGDRGAAGAESAAGGGPDADAAGSAASHYRRAVEWYRQAAGPAEAARGCAQCARALDRMGLHEEALSAIESAAELDASHALKCAGMHRRRGDDLAKRRAKGARGAGAASEAGGAESGREMGLAAKGSSANDAASRYGRAVEWYLRAARADGAGGRNAEAARGCAQCARRLDRMGLAEEALSALEAAADLDGGAYAQECGARCGRLADGLAREGGGPSRDARRMYDRALARYRTAAASGGPGASRALLDAAAVCMKIGQYARAAEAFNDAHRIGGGDLRAECTDGICECACGLAALCDGKGVDRCLELEAMADQQDRLKLAERCSELARREHESGRHEQAASCYAAAVSIDGDDMAARLGLAGSLARLGRHEEAIGHYGIVAERGGEHATAALFGLAGSYGATGRHVRAAECLARAAEADPARAAECAERCSELARREHESGRHKQAASCYAAAVSIDGDDMAARLGLAGSLALLGRHEEAIGQYGIVVERGGEHAGVARLGLAGSLARLGRHEEAIGHYGIVAERGGEHATAALFGLAGSYGATGRHVRAAECLARAAEADPARAAECAERCSELARREHESGRHKQAASCYAAAVSIDGDDMAARLGLADSWRMDGRGGDALREYSGIRRAGDAGQRARAYIGIARLLAEESRHADAAGLACMAAKAAEEAGGIAACSAECSALCAECGDAMQGEGLHGGAYACYAMGLSVDPRNACANCGIGDHMAGRGLYQDALRHYKAALEADGDMIRALVGAGAALCELARGAPPSGGIHSYDDAERMFEWALAIEPENFLAHMGAGRASLGRKNDGLESAASHFCNAAALRPGDRDAHMGAGEALRMLARFHTDRDMPGKASECYGRAMGHYERAMSAPGSGGMLAPGYWKGVCMLHLEQDGKKARAFMRGVLKRASPRGSADHDFCGKIYDILGDYEKACTHYVESMRGSALYPDGFYKTIDGDRIHAGSMIPAGLGAAGEVAKAGGHGIRGGTGDPDAGGVQTAYVLDANVIIDCAAESDRNLDDDVASAIVKGIKDGDCRLPQAAFDEAYGVTKNRGYGDLGARLRSWGAELESMRSRRGADQCMKRARGALMIAWLYSSKKAKERWRSRKFGSGKAPYGGGPPTGRDVEILATAVHLADAGGTSGPCPVVLVTSDSDFLDFAYYIREALSIEVERPESAAGLLVRAARERELREELGKRTAGGGSG